MRVCMCACMRAFVRLCVSACACVGVCIHVSACFVVNVCYTRKCVCGAVRAWETDNYYVGMMSL